MLMRNIHRQQAGLGIVEMMVSIMIASIVLAGMVALVLNLSVTSGTNLKSGQLNQALRGSFDYLLRDLARAGYVNWAAAWDNCNPAENTPGLYDDANGDGTVDILDFYQCVTPALAEFGLISLAAFDTPGDADSGVSDPDCSTDCDCILYRYDIDQNGELSTGDFELFGFRHHQGRLQSRTGAGAGVAHSCVTGTWTDLTDPVAEITRLAFSVVYAGSAGAGDSTVYSITGGVSGGVGSTCTPGAGDLGDDKCLWRRNITLEMDGRLAADPTVQMSLNGEVKIRNDHFQTEAS
jgi:type II secretory pathway component PulJ